MNFCNSSGTSSNRLFHWLMMLIIALSAGTACKKSKKRSGGGAPPATDIGADGTAAGACDAALTVIQPLGPAALTSLNLTSADLENVKVGSYNTAKLIFQLDPDSATPDKYVYYSCCTNDKNKCVLGSTATGQDFNPNLPECSLNIKAWACVRPQRVVGYPQSLNQYASSKITVNKEDFYCGAPVVHYDKQDSNFGNETLGSIQSLIKTLEEKRFQLAYNIVKIVQGHVSNAGQGTGLAAGTTTVSGNDLLWYNIAAGGDLSAEAIARFYDEAKDAAEQGIQLQNSGGGLGLTALKLTNEAGENCIPLPEPSTITNPPPFTPPAVTTPSKVPAVIEQSTGESTGPASEEPVKNDPVTTPADTNSVSEEQNCANRNEWFRSQGLGAAEWDAQRKRCFHIRETGEKTEIDVSIDPEQLNPPSDLEEPVIDEEEGWSGWQKTGAVMMAIGGVMGIAGAGTWAYYKYGPGKDQPPGTPPNQGKRFQLISELNTKSGVDMQKAGSIWGALDSESKTFADPVLTEKAKIKDPYNFFSYEDGSKIKPSQLFINPDGKYQMSAVTGKAVEIDDVGNKVTTYIYETKKDGKTFNGRKLVIEGEDAVASAKKLQANIDKVNQALDELNRIGSSNLTEYTEYKRQLGDLETKYGLAAIDPSNRSTFLASLPSQERANFQAFERLESKWGKAHNDFVSAKSAADASNQIFSGKFVAQHDYLNLKPKTKKSYLDAAVAQEKLFKLEADELAFTKKYQDLRYRAELETKYRSLDPLSEEAKRLKGAMDDFDTKWKLDVDANAKYVANQDSLLGKGKNFIDNLKANPGDAGLKGGLLGAAMFAIGGIMASGALGLTDGSSQLSKSITRDIQGDLDNIEVINGMIQRLQSRHSSIVISAED